MTIPTQHDFAHNDHRARFRAAVDSLTTNTHLTVPERLAAIQSLTDAYIAQTSSLNDGADVRPDAWQLERLASWVLKRDAEEREQERKLRKSRKKTAA